jgi:hypothetical protein
MTPATLTASFRVDAAPTSVVIVCRDCGWRDLAGDRCAAWVAAAGHARAAHPDQLTAALSNARAAMYRKRHAPGRP